MALCAAAAAVVLMVGAYPAGAQVPAGPEFRVNTYTTSSQRRPAVTADGKGNFVVVWRSQAQDGSGYGVIGRRFDASGTPLGDEFLVNTYTTGSQTEPAVAAGRDGSFVVAWQSPHEFNDFGVFARRFDASGTPRGAEFRVNTFTTSSQLSPAVAADGRGNFVIVWRSNGQDGSGFGIFGQRYDLQGMPLGQEFSVNTLTMSNQMGPAVAADPAGNFVVVWDGPDPALSSDDVFGQRFDPSGSRIGTEFMVNAITTGQQFNPTVAMDAAGNFTVAWSSDQGGPPGDVFARRFDRTGAPLGIDFVVNTYTTDGQSEAAIATDDLGNFVVTWGSGRQDGDFAGVFGQRHDSSGARRGGEFQINTTTTGNQSAYWHAVASDPNGNFVVSWSSIGDGNGYGIFAQRFGGLLPATLGADPAAGPVSDGNGVFEPQETVVVAPGWRNVNGVALSFDGLASGYTGPPGPVYTIVDATATYGAVANGGVGRCAGAAGCYVMNVNAPAGRPATHWDTVFREAIVPAALGQSKSWTLHIGDSFTDVPRVNPFYRFVETLLHHGVTGGCTASAYCPAASASREQMAVFVLVAKEGAGYTPPACTTPMFADVPASNPFCRWIEELARRGVVAGCGGGNYCPTAPVSREQMAVFVLATKEPGITPPACGTPMFNDVPASNPFCRWIEELARRGVVAGCGGGNYCPAAPVTREQMAVFISGTFGLALYGL